LEALTYTHRGKFDAIYIDPPYNTGAKDWKYNNDYVESEDLYRHSKWLAFIERRLRIAKELLNPSCSVLIITIDEKEYLRLGLLLEQIFPEAPIEMVTSVISAKGVARAGQFSRVEEFIFFVKVGDSVVDLGEQNMLDDSRSASSEIGKKVNWLGLRRREPTAKRGARPNQFYPIFVYLESGYIHSIGDPIADDIDRNAVEAPEGCFAVWPLRPNGDEGLWGITPGTARKYHEQGFIRSRNHRPGRETSSINYLPSGTVKAIFEDRIEIVGRDLDGAVQAVYKEAKGVIPKRVWNMPSHNAENGGSVLLSKIIPNKRFPFPKSLYAVEDALRFFIGKNPQALVLDFFAGSGTTAHAVMRLNKQDGGSRISISVTNNEVAADELSNLRKEKLRPGDPDWEKWGICDYITKPRIKSVISGKTPAGLDIEGDYKFSDIFPMAYGFQENAEFFTLTYETPIAVRHNVAFKHIAPLLWMRAGSKGSRIEKITEQGWDVVETYGVLVSLDQANLFCKAIQSNQEVQIAYIVTDDDRRFQAVARHLPDSVEPVRLYESYLSNFRFSMGR
jgi:adenine-specific DNA-methyltransferase